MKYKILCAFAILSFAVASAHAQTPNAWTFSCGLPDEENNVVDNGRVLFTVGLLRCTTTGGGIAATAGKDSIVAYHREVSGNQVHVYGVFVQVFANGDVAGYAYQGAATMVNGQVKTAQLTYHINAGTGRMAGITGSGTCTMVYTPDGASTAACSGLYTLAAPAPMKK